MNNCYKQSGGVEYRGNAIRDPVSEHKSLYNKTLKTLRYIKYNELKDKENRREVPIMNSKERWRLAKVHAQNDLSGYDPSDYSYILDPSQRTEKMRELKTKYDSTRLPEKIMGAIWGISGARKKKKTKGSKKKGHSKKGSKGSKKGSKKGQGGGKSRKPKKAKQTRKRPKKSRSRRPRRMRTRGQKRAGAARKGNMYPYDTYGKK